MEGQEMTHALPEPDQLNLTSPDMKQARLNELKRLFPDLFDGEGGLDDAALRALTSPDGATSTERFRFEWAGKQQSKRYAFAPSRATLVADPDRSVDFETTNNLMIEGDNLEVLKLLQKTYFERVKCIYIDPPYNTKNDFIYPDDYSETKKAYWRRNGTVKDGVKLTALTEADGRKHSFWLNMISARLYAARLLLHERGVIFISIGDEEVHNLRKVCDEVFGETNFLGLLPRRKKVGGGSASDHFAIEHDYVLAFAKNKLALGKLTIPHDPEYVKRYKEEDECGKYFWDTMERASTATTPYLIEAPDGEMLKGNWFRSEETYLADKEKGETRFIKNGDKWSVQFKQRLSDGRKLRSLMAENEFKSSQDDLESLSMGGLFDYPKPVFLISTLMSTIVEDGDIVLDFFAGSGTTGHAAFTYNATFNKRAQFILVQVPEFISEDHAAFKAGFKTISSVCIERVKRAGDKAKADHAEADTDTGFRVYRLIESFFPQNLFVPDPGKTEDENLAALKAHLEADRQSTLFGDDNFSDLVTEIALKNGYGLFHSVEKMEVFTQNNLYRLSGNGKAALLCLDETLSEKTVEALHAHSNQQLILASRALDTTKKWMLQNVFKENLHTV